jgi:hypothetical protein
MNIVTTTIRSMLGPKYSLSNIEHCAIAKGKQHEL